jgi:site-specific recombinase XerD
MAGAACVIDLRLPGRGESNKRRAVVPIGGALLRHLRWAAKRARDKRVVPMAKITLRRSWATARAAAGLTSDVTPVTLRHTLGSWAAQDGNDLYKVGKMLGHSRPQTTARYAKLATDHLRGVMMAGLRGAKMRH